eukprot:scaffold396191_cov30-Prasinocladus_malaysianus.AAC.1
MLASDGALQLEIALAEGYPTGASEMSVTCNNEVIYLDEVMVEGDEPIMILETDKPGQRLM